MWNRAGVTKSVHFAAAALLLSVVGCQNAADSDRDVSAANSSMLKVRTPHRPIKIAEGALLSYRPRVFNWDALEGTVAFEVAGGELPEGCVLDEATGEVVWTPTETQGPGTYNLEFACRSNDEPENTTAYQVELQVVEANVAPRLDAPVDVSAAAGSTLEHLLGLADDDFPGNRVSLELTAGPAGAGVDEIGKLVYWEIPADWQQPRAEITVTAHDDGVPPLSTSRTFVVTVTDIATPEPERDMPSDATERVP